MKQFQNSKHVSGFTFRNGEWSRISVIGFRNSRRAGAGFGLIETVVGTAIISLVLIGLADAGRLALRSVDQANFESRAAFLAEEGIEAVKTMRDAGWASHIAPLALDTDYFYSFSAGAWRLDATHGPLVDGVFTRRVRFSAVCRDASDNIAACGSPVDTNIKKVVVDVGWVNRGQNATTTISTYLANIFNN